jgi:hypothetical protein
MLLLVNVIKMINLEASKDGQEYRVQHDAKLEHRVMT